jgi:hypothetical protein
VGHAHHLPLSVVATLIFGVAAINAARTSYRRQTRRGPVRLFNRLDKALIFGRAGGRCGHHAAIFGRCEVTDTLEADHFHLEMRRQAYFPAGTDNNRFTPQPRGTQTLRRKRWPRITAYFS